MMKLKHPTAIVSLLIVAFAFALSIAAFAVSTIVAQHTHDQALTETQRALNGNQAMIFAVCRGFQRRDNFEMARLNHAITLEIRYQKMTKPFSPLVKEYFHDRRVAIVHSAEIEKKQFVDFDCIKGMEKAYDQGYRDSLMPTGKPLPTYHAFEVPKK